MARPSPTSCTSRGYPVIARRAPPAHPTALARAGLPDPDRRGDHHGRRLGRRLGLRRWARSWATARSAASRASSRWHSRCADVALIALCDADVHLLEPRSRALQLLTAAPVPCSSSATSATASARLQGWYDGDGPLDLLWVVSYLLWGAAALHPAHATWHPSARSTRRGSAGGGSRSSRSPFLAAPAMLLYGAVRTSGTELVVSASAADDRLPSRRRAARAPDPAPEPGAAARAARCRRRRRPLRRRAVAGRGRARSRGRRPSELAGRRPTARATGVRSLAGDLPTDPIVLGGTDARRAPAAGARRRARPRPAPPSHPSSRGAARRGREGSRLVLVVTTTAAIQPWVDACIRDARLAGRRSPSTSSIGPRPARAAQPGPVRGPRPALEGRDRHPRGGRNDPLRHPLCARRPRARPRGDRRQQPPAPALAGRTPTPSRRSSTLPCLPTDGSSASGACGTSTARWRSFDAVAHRHARRPVGRRVRRHRARHHRAQGARGAAEPPGVPRRAHRSAEPRALRRPGLARPLPGALPGRSQCSSSTSTTSRPSTTASATTPATRSSSRWPSACAPASGPRTRRRASAATSSPFSSRRSMARRSRSRSPTGCSRRSASRSTSAAPPPTPARASASRSAIPAAASAISSGTPTSRCTAPSPPGGSASPSSSTRCTTRPTKRLQLKADLARALEDDRLDVAFQPIVAARLGRGDRGRGAPAVDACRARPDLARRVRAPGRGDGAHPRARAMGARARDHDRDGDGRRWRAASTRSSASTSRRGSYRTPGSSRSSGDTLAAAGFDASRLVLEITECDADDRPGAGDRTAGRAPRPRRAGLDRRLRNGVLVAQLPPRPSRQRAEDPQAVRRRARRRRDERAGSPTPSSRWPSRCTSTRSPRASSSPSRRTR